MRASNVTKLESSTPWKPATDRAYSTLLKLKTGAVFAFHKRVHLDARGHAGATVSCYQPYLADRIAVYAS